MGFASRLNPPYEIWWRLPVDAAHAEVFDFEEFLDAVFRAFAAYADVRNLVTLTKAGAYREAWIPAFAGRTSREIALSDLDGSEH